MRKHPKLRLLAARCPHCGSCHTKVDWSRLDNYRMAVLTTVVALFGELVGRYDRVCLDCGRKFSP